MQRDSFTLRYSGKRFKRLFPAVAPSFNEACIFTRRVVQVVQIVTTVLCGDKLCNILLEMSKNLITVSVFVSQFNSELMTPKS
jgi:hypothetical protein